MPDLLIRDFPAAELAALDTQAKSLGLSRAEFLRRQLLQTARRRVIRVTVADLDALGALIADVADEDLMRQAWS